MPRAESKLALFKTLCGAPSGDENATAFAVGLAVAVVVHVVLVLVDCGGGEEGGGRVRKVK